MEHILALIERADPILAEVLLEYKWAAHDADIAGALNRLKPGIIATMKKVDQVGETIKAKDAVEAGRTRIKAREARPEKRPKYYEPRSTTIGTTILSGSLGAMRKDPTWRSMHTSQR